MKNYKERWKVFLINKEKIVLHEKFYYVPTYIGIAKVTIEKIVENNLLVVKVAIKNEKAKPFVILIDHVYNKPEHANIGLREWEHWKRKCKRKN